MRAVLCIPIWAARLTKVARTGEAAASGAFAVSPILGLRVLGYLITNPFCK